MASIIRGFKYLLTNRALFCDSFIKNYLGFLPDKLFLTLRYRCVVGHWINWKQPKTFSEKIQWLKIYDRRPEYVKMVDKYCVKQYVSELIGDDYIIPTLGVWDDPESINWDDLPNQFVLKTTHSGGSCGVVVCKDKNNFNKEEAIKKLKTSLDQDDIYTYFREWPYAQVKRRIIAEKFIASNSPHGDLPDYKFFCFNGEPVYCQVIRDRNENETIDFYDMEWNHQEFVGLQTILSNKVRTMQNGTTPVPCPIHLDTLKELCRKLSSNIPFVRIDMYVVDSKEYFGEMTFFPASGLGTFSPEEWHYKLGELIDLSNIK